MAPIAAIGPNQDWSSQATTKSRTVVFYLLSACVGVALATGVVYLASNRMSTHNVAAPAPNISADADVESVADDKASLAVPPDAQPEIPSELDLSDLAEVTPMAGQNNANQQAAEHKARMDLVDMIPESSPIRRPEPVTESPEGTTQPESPVSPASFEKKRPATSTPIDNFSDIGAESVQPVATESARPALTQLPSLPDSTSPDEPERHPAAGN